VSLSEGVCTVKFEDGDIAEDVQEDEVMFSDNRPSDWGKGELRGNDLLPEGASPVTFGEIEMQEMAQGGEASFMSGTKQFMSNVAGRLGMMGNPVVTPVLRDDNVTHAQNVELRGKQKQSELQRRIDRSLTGGDQAVGEEALQRDLKNEDIEQWRRDFEREYGKVPEFDDPFFRKALLAGLFLSCAAGLFCLFHYKEEEYESYYEKVLYGLIIGFVLGTMAEVGRQYLETTDIGMGGQQRRAMSQRMEQIRRMEQQAMERHDEFVYYDTGRSNSRWYNCLCCPLYTKITSRRLSFSSPNPPKEVPCGGCCCPSVLCDTILGMWFKRTHNVNYKRVVDVGVEQTCHDFIYDTGTIVAHCRTPSGVKHVSTPDKEGEDRIAIEMEDGGVPSGPDHVVYRISGVHNAQQVMDDMGYRIATHY